MKDSFYRIETPSGSGVYTACGTSWSAHCMPFDHKRHPGPLRDLLLRENAIKKKIVSSDSFESFYFKESLLPSLRFGFLNPAQAFQWFHRKKYWAEMEKGGFVVSQYSGTIIKGASQGILLINKKHRKIRTFSPLEFYETFKNEKKRI